MHRTTRDMVCPLLRADRGQADAKVEKIHVEYKFVMVCVVYSAMPGEAAACAGHMTVKALHGFIKAMLCGASHHGIGVAQMLLVGLQQVTDYGHHSRLNPRPSGGQGLEKLPIHLTPMVGGKPNHGKRSRGTLASTKKVTFVYSVEDVGGQVPAYYLHVPRPLMYGHARPTHVHRQTKIHLKALTRGDFQQLFRAGREKIRLESCSLQIVRKQWEVRLRINAPRCVVHIP